MVFVRPDPAKVPFVYKEGVYAYARIERVEPSQGRDICHCVCIDGYSRFEISKVIVASRAWNGVKGNVGEYFWCKMNNLWLQRPTFACYRGAIVLGYKIKSDVKDSIILNKELHLLYELTADSPHIRVPVSRVNIRTMFVEVALTPNLRGTVDWDSIPDEMKESLEPGTIITVDIVDVIQPDDDPVPHITLRVSEQQIRISKPVTIQESDYRFNNSLSSRYELLPPELSQVHFIVDRNMHLYLQEEDRAAPPGKKLSDSLLPDMSSTRAVLRALDPIYQKAKEERQISFFRVGNNIINAEFPTGFRNHLGVPYSVGLKYNMSDQKWIVTVIGFTKADIFKRLVYFPDPNRMLDTLADLALPGEVWSSSRRKRVPPGSNTSDSGEPIEKDILQSYLQHTFYKAWLDGLVLENEYGEAVFNTGLVDRAYDDICCYLKKYEGEREYIRPKWTVGGFACFGKDTEGKNLNRRFFDRPQAPIYINMDNPQELVYDYRKELLLDYDHILDRRTIRRLPFQFILKYISVNSPAAAVYQKLKSDSGNRTLRQFLYDAVANDPDILRALKSQLEQATEIAKRRCQWNYKTAIPVYYARNNRISLLLPLCLLNDTTVDVALVIERLPNGKYQGQTIYDLAMAYQDARQICRPESEWLTARHAQ